MNSFTFSNKTLCFGEALIRLSPHGNQRIEQTEDLQLFVEGAEAMTALSLASQGERVAYMTTISDNRLAKKVVMTLAGAGIDLSRVQQVPGRMGLFYFERGSGERPANVVYDRNNTPITLLSRSDFDWDSLLNGIDSFYFSGTLAAINAELRLALLDALHACKGRGIQTFCDLNFRSRMWTVEEARQSWNEFLPFIDVCIANDEDIWSLFPQAGIMPNKITTLGFLDYYRDVAQDLTMKFGCHTVAIEIRSLATSGIGRWSALLYKDGTFAYAGPREIMSGEHSGCGDSFAAGIIHGIHKAWVADEIITYALTSSVLKASIPGSINYLSSEEIHAATHTMRTIVDY
ncbi:sugar kinase [Collinsella sp. zg1085]|uniref:sugar kinase n=1 Tax=Collinsella sp. zg1085 TaxID=2844380 RepID=UPI001C0E5045|nr:sugar kinase [Collinsella sp. zg1085]QWT17936.1 sugar kinase [Collinsella sp. zg1085]